MISKRAYGDVNGLAHGSDETSQAVVILTTSVGRRLEPSPMVEGLLRPIARQANDTDRLSGLSEIRALPSTILYVENVAAERSQSSGLVMTRTDTRTGVDPTSGAHPTPQKTPPTTTNENCRTDRNGR